jgi:hypothetical protein
MEQHILATRLRMSNLRHAQIERSSEARRRGKHAATNHMRSTQVGDRQRASPRAPCDIVDSQADSCANIMRLGHRGSVSWRIDRRRKPQRATYRPGHEDTDEKKDMVMSALQTSPNLFFFLFFLFA